MLRQLLHRTASRIALATGTRRFDAASPRRWDAAATMGPLNSEIIASAAVIRRRSSYFARNNPWLTSGIDALVSGLVGTGIRPTSKHPDPAVRATLQAAWDRWTRQADAEGRLDFYGLQTVAVRQMIEGGEVFVHLQADDSAVIPLRLRLIAADQVDPSATADHGPTGQLVAGIEFDGQGRRTAYQVSAQPIGLFATTLPPITVPAVDVLHLFQTLAPGQVRGVAWTAPVLLRLNDLDALEDATLIRQKIAALFAGFVVEPDADPATNVVDGSFDVSLEPGVIQRLAPGQDIRFANPGDAAAGTSFIMSQLRAVAAGLGVPAHLLTGDLSDANYSSLRAALVAFNRRLEAIQFGTLIPLFLRPVWERFIVAAVLSGAIEAPDFEAHLSDYMAVEFYPPPQQWVDPLKDAEAEAAAIAAGLKSRRQAVAEQGYDVEVLDAEIAADRAREKSLGLAFTTPLPADAGATP